MKAFNRLLLTALIAGVLSGLFLAAVQHFTIMPMLFEAESYETGGSDGLHAGDEAWAPEDGIERTFYTALNSMIVGFGFGLLLTACYALRGSVTWRAGILWGLGGFAAFNLAPALGLPPELPGDAAAGLGERQLWWVLTVIVTAMGLWIIAFQPKRSLKLFGLAFILIPHIVGAPQPAVHESLAPAELRSMFIYTSLFTNAIFWIVLGILCAIIYNRMGENNQHGSVNPAVS